MPEMAVVAVVDVQQLLFGEIYFLQIKTASRFQRHYLYKYDLFEVGSTNNA